MGSLDGVDNGARTSLGGIVNKGSIFIGPGTLIELTGPKGVTDIPKGASWEIGAPFTGFARLTGIEGSLDIEGAIDRFSNISPLVLGSPGNTIKNSGLFQIGSSFGASVVTVIGNLSNTGDVEVALPASPPPRLQTGPSTLNVSGTLTNQANATLGINNSTYSLFATPYLAP